VTDLRSQFGDIDIYLFDQLLRGRIAPGATVLDAGCGWGRNLVYFLQGGYDVHAVDADPAAVDAVRSLAARLSPAIPAEHFRVEAVEAMTFPEGAADVVISSAVLHFARDDRQFDAMLRGTWRTVRSGGFLFCRLASSIGMADRMRPVGGGRFTLPDGSERYLVDEPALVRLTADLGARLLDPIKTTVVQNQRCMTTWVVARP
jgi:SAM-dependent methyltransferase